MSKNLVQEGSHLNVSFQVKNQTEETKKLREDFKILAKNFSRRVRKIERAIEIMNKVLCSLSVYCHLEGFYRLSQTIIVQAVLAKMEVLA